MATLEELAERGDVKKVRIHLKYPDTERRTLYVMPTVEKWIREDLAKLASFDDTDISPLHQARAVFRLYISGEAMSEGDEFRLMQPHEQDIYELKSADLRVFGWFYRPSVFIAVVADTMEKVHTIDGLSSAYRNAVAQAREALDLDPPKFIAGASIEHVFAV